MKKISWIMKKISIDGYGYVLLLKAIFGTDLIINFEIKDNNEIKIMPKEIKEAIEEALKTLTERETKVLKMRFGLEDGNLQTLREIGMQLKVTRERIRQIEAKALRKLKHPSRSQILKSYLNRR